MYQSPKNRSREPQDSSQYQFSISKQQQQKHILTLRQVLNPMIFDLWEMKKSPPNLKISQYEPFQLKNNQPFLCSKEFKNSQPVIECFDCRKTNSSAICGQCFKSSNHQGHKYIINIASGGCCDCGDELSWNKQGFCKQHTGIMPDIQIPLQQQEKFVKTYSQLFLVYYLKVQRSNIKKNQRKDVQNYLKAILLRLIQLNTKSLYYNKLTTCLFQHIVPSQALIFPKHYKKYPILVNLLRYSCQQISELANKLYFNMFSYSLFKQLLCNYYLQYYRFLIDGTTDSSLQSASLSCQFLNNQNIMKVYLAQQQPFEVGYNVKIQDKMLQQVGNTSLVIFRDIKFIIQSSPTNALLYWKINVKRGLQNLFLYYQKTKSIMELILQNSSSSTAAYKKIPDLLQCFHIEITLMQLICLSLNKIKCDQKLIIQLLYKLYLKIQEDNKSKIGQSVYKSYQRVFILVLFCYFKLNLNNISPSSIHQLLQKFKQIGYQVEEHKFKKNIQGVLRTIFSLVYNSIKLMKDTQLFIVFFLFMCSYSIKNKMIFFLDVVGVKMLILLLDHCPTIDYCTLIDLQGRFTSQKLNFALFTQIIESLNKIFLSNFYEAYISAKIDKQCTLYNEEIENIFIDIFTQNKNEFLKKDLSKLEQFIHPSTLQNLIRKLCDKHKTSEKYILKKQVPTFNKMKHKLLDFRFIGNIEQSRFQQEARIFKLIRGYNENIFKTVWNSKQILKLLQRFTELQNMLLTDEIRQQQKKLQFLKIMHCVFSQLQLLKKFNVQQIQSYYQKLLQNSSVKVWIQENKEKLFRIQLEQENKKDIQQINKEKIEAVRKAKMQEMRQKQKKVIEKRSIKSEEDVNEDNQNQISECLICKQSSSDCLVYLVKVSIANFDKLFHRNEGYGIECLSFKTCYHVFHAGCINKSKQKNKELIKCPLCSQKFNFILPISQKIENKHQFMSKIELILFNMKQYMQLDIKEQIIKSFYHLVLLAISDWQYTISKLLPLYRCILTFLQKCCQPKDTKRLRKKVKDNNWTLIPKTNNKQKTLQNINPNNQSLTNNLFIVTVSTIVDIITHKKKQTTDFQIIMNQNHKKVAKVILKALSTIDLNDEQLKQNPLKNRQFRLRPLPSKFTPLSEYHSCSQCQQITPILFLCLICDDWAGCIKCQNSKLIMHTHKYHGSAGVFMILRKASVIYLHGQNLTQLDELYEDGSLQPFNIKKCLGNYYLKEQMIEEIEKKILHEEYGESGQQY